MPSDLKYMPTFRSRQQENLVLRSFDFGNYMFPLVEIIKAKDRVNNPLSSFEIYNDLIGAIQAENVFIDLPTYIKDVAGMSDEVVSFNRTWLSNIERRIEFYNALQQHNDKIIPVVSTLILKTGEINTITTQFQALRRSYSSLAIRTFTNTFNSDLNEIRALLTDSDFLIYDIDANIALTNPIIKRDTNALNLLDEPCKIALRSAINTEIQNIRLNHGDVVLEADNSLKEMYKIYHFNAFGDYAGIKKDDLSSGGTISPGFIFYDPVDNLYCGYKGDVKSLQEFETTIVPAVINSSIVTKMRETDTDYLNNRNVGWNTLQNINNHTESGKSQAKFKRISIEHYLHTIRTDIEKGRIN